MAGPRRQRNGCASLELGRRIRAWHKYFVSALRTYTGPVRDTRVVCLASSPGTRVLCQVRAYFYARTHETAYGHGITGILWPQNACHGQNHALYSRSSTCASQKLFSFHCLSDFEASRSREIGENLANFFAPPARKAVVNGLCYRIAGLHLGTYARLGLRAYGRAARNG